MHNITFQLFCGASIFWHLPGVGTPRIKYQGRKPTYMYLPETKRDINYIRDLLGMEEVNGIIIVSDNAVPHEVTE